MIVLRLDQLAAAVGGTVLNVDARAGVAPGHMAPVSREATTVSHIVTDSRQIDRSDHDEGVIAFVALRTADNDGHQYLADAVQRGARLLLVDEASADEARALAATLDQPDLAVVSVDDTWRALRALAGTVRTMVDPTVVAITGSVGKTTVKDLCRAALATALTTHASPQSFNNELGVPLTLLGMSRTTQAVVVEIGARMPGDIAALATVARPDIAVVTAVAPAHLGPFGSMEAIAATKRELVESLDDHGVAVLNVDWPHVATMTSAARRCVTVSTLRHDTDVHAEHTQIGDDGRVRLRAATPWGRVAVSAPLPGRHQAANVLLALAVAGSAGIDVHAAAEAIGQAHVSAWRGQQLRLSDDLTVIDDAYNANPASMRAALETLSLLGEGRPTVAVLGEMAELGPDAVSLHEQVGEHAASLGIDTLVVVGEGARGLTVGAQRRDTANRMTIVQVGDRTGACEWLATRLPHAATVLVKGSRVAQLDEVVEHLRQRRSLQ